MPTLPGWTWYYSYRFKHINTRHYIKWRQRSYFAPSPTQYSADDFTPVWNRLDDGSGTQDLLADTSTRLFYALTNPSRAAYSILIMMDSIPYLTTHVLRSNNMMWMCYQKSTNHYHDHHTDAYTYTYIDVCVCAYMRRYAHPCDAC